MNKEELKQKIISDSDKAEAYISDWEVVGVDDVCDLIDQLDEPEKVVIPQFVADYIERAKPRHDSLYQAMDERASDEIKEWVRGFYNSDTFARAWLSGYGIDKEPLYHMPVPYLEDAYYRNDDLKGLTSFKKYSKFTQTELDERFPDIKHMAVEVSE